jgi:hypothetical protein
MKIFDVIDQLIAAIPLTPEKVGKILDTRLARDKDSDTAAITAYAQPDTAKGSRWDVVDLRMPDEDIGDGIVFLSVTLRSDEGADQAAISERYGSDFRSEIPSPRYKPGTVPVYLTYDLEWGSLAFGVSADKERKLIRFVLNTPATVAAADDDA